MRSLFQLDNWMSKQSNLSSTGTTGTTGTTPTNITPISSSSDYDKKVLLWKSDTQTITRTLTFTFDLEGKQLEKYYTIDLNEFIEAENCIFTPKSISLNSVIYDEEKCHELKVGYTPCPICDAEISQFPLESFGQVFGGKEKIIDITVDNPSIAWTKKNSDRFSSFNGV